MQAAAAAAPAQRTGAATKRHHEQRPALQTDGAGIRPRANEASHGAPPGTGRGGRPPQRHARRAPGAHPENETRNTQGTRRAQTSRAPTSGGTRQRAPPPQRGRIHYSWGEHTTGRGTMQRNYFYLFAGMARTWHDSCCASLARFLLCEQDSCQARSDSTRTTQTDPDAPDPPGPPHPPHPPHGAPEACTVRSGKSVHVLL